MTLTQAGKQESHRRGNQRGGEARLERRFPLGRTGLSWVAAGCVLGLAAGAMAQDDPAPGGFGNLSHDAAAGGVMQTGLGPAPFFSLKAEGADFIQAGFTTRGSLVSDPLDIPLPLPNGPVQAVYVVWNYLLDGFPPDSDTIIINNTLVNGTRCGAGSPDLCWDKEGAAAYIAEVAPSLINYGGGSNFISGATDKPLGDDPTALGEGISIVAVYTVPGEQRRNVDLYCGYTSNTTNPGAEFNLAYSATYFGGSAHFFLNALDGQLATPDSPLGDDLFIFGDLASGMVNGTGVPGDAWRGDLGPLDFFNNLFDHADDDIRRFLTPDSGSLGGTTVVAGGGLGDCVGHSLAAISFVCDPKNVVAKWQQLPHGFEASCCYPHSDPGCNSNACESLVCQMDPFCCDVAWDQLCVDAAFELCTDVCTDQPLGFNVASDIDWQSMAPPCECDINGDGACDISDLTQLLTCFGSPPGPSCPDYTCDGIVDDQDIAVMECLLQGNPPQDCCEPCPQPPCTCDINGDGDCNISDLTQLLQCFGSPPGPGCPDYNCDGMVDQIDVEALECLLEGNPPDVCCEPCGAPPNWVVADDFVSDGRPITCVRWWGSYLDSNFQPGSGGPGCDCDINGDGDCDINDVLAILQCVGSPPSDQCPADLNCDGMIGEEDIFVWECLVSGDPQITCCTNCTTIEQIDGWFVSFHSDLPDVDNPGGFNRPAELLGLYFCPAEAVTVRGEDFVGWDEHRVFEYTVDLADACLVHTNIDARNDTFPAHPRKFRETADFVYWLDIQAVVGHRLEPNPDAMPLCNQCECDLDGSGDCDIADLLELLNCFGSPDCPDINCDGVMNEDDITAWICLASGIPDVYCCDTDEPVCEEIPTDSSADDHFWGWHTSPDEWNGQSVMGRLVMGPDGQWQYVNWQPVDGQAHDLEIVDQAFELLTPFCPGDVNGDREVDVQDLVLVVLSWDTDDVDADVNCDGEVSVQDLVVVVLNWGDCPE